MAHSALQNARVHRRVVPDHRGARGRQALTGHDTVYEGKGTVAVATCVEKTLVVATLRARHLHGRADWVDRQLPELIDTARNASLLRTLGINIDTLTRDARPDRGPASCE